MSKTNRFPKYLYHATTMKNLITILKEKRLVSKGDRINGYDEQTVSFSDILSDYLIFYGYVIIEFIAKKLFVKNNIFPYKYEIAENSDDFYDMPFWEAEWRANKVKFAYKDINKIYFLTPPLLTMIRFLQDKKIKFVAINADDLPSHSEEFFINKYRERIKLLEEVTVT